jgi:hypothetical protein
MTTFCIAFYESYLSTVQDNRVKIRWSYWAPTFEYMYASSQTKEKISWVMCNKEGWTRKLQKADMSRDEYFLRVLKIKSVLVV